MSKIPEMQKNKNANANKRKLSYSLRINRFNLSACQPRYMVPSVASKLIFPFDEMYVIFAGPFQRSIHGLPGFPLFV